MKQYLVFSSSDAFGREVLEKAKLLPKGVNFWAAILGPLWLLYNALWLELGFWLVFMTFAVGSLSQTAPLAGSLLYCLPAPFLFLEANQMRIARYERSDKRKIAVITACDKDDAEAQLCELRLDEVSPQIEPKETNLVADSEPKSQNWSVRA